MVKTTRLILAIPVCFTLLVGWFAWSAFRAAPPLAAENLRGAGLSMAAAIEQLLAVDPTGRSLARYTTPDIAYFALTDRNGVVRFHTNPGLIGQPLTPSPPGISPAGYAEQRQRLGTGEEVYLLRTRIHPDHDQLLLNLALHTYRADQVIRRARTGVTMVAALTVALWGLTGLLLYLLRKDDRRRRAMERREELARLGEMGAVMAHEIRNPLAGIKGFAQLIEGAKEVEPAHLYAGKIVAQSLRLEALVNDLLAFARNDREERQPIDLSLLVRDCVDLIRTEAVPARIAIEHRAHPPLKCRVVADRLMQLLINLMKNGVQAMPEGGVLRVGVEQTGNLARITVADTGVGIPPAALPHIFEPFWTSKAQGTGLGLALCRKVAEEHGGRLQVESAPGTGTTVSVEVGG